METWRPWHYVYYPAVGRPVAYVPMPQNTHQVLLATETTLTILRAMRRFSTPYKENKQ